MAMNSSLPVSPVPCRSFPGHSQGPAQQRRTARDGEGSDELVLQDVRIDSHERSLSQYDEWKFMEHELLIKMRYDMKDYLIIK